MQHNPESGPEPGSDATTASLPPRRGQSSSSGIGAALHSIPAIMLVLGLLSALALAIPLVSRTDVTANSPGPAARPGQATGATTPASPKVAQSEPGPRAPDMATVAPRPPQSFQDALKSVTPATPWLSLPATSVLNRIGFGSCLDQRFPQPIWSAVLKAKPQLFMMIGDNVYGDIKSPDAKELAEAYRRQLAHPEFAEARAALPMLGMWDDHDYGLNDGGAGFAQREAAAELFRSYWQMPAAKAGGSAAGSSAAGTDGLQYARIYGPEGQRVQIIMLDARSFRSPFGPKPADSNLFGKYGPDVDPAKTMLGAGQWAWLEGELRKPAEIRLLVSSIQVLSEGHGFERWGNLPLERDRLMKLIETTGAKGVLLLSGDRHVGAIYNRPLAASQILIEITSSSLNRSYGPAKDVRTPELISDLHHAENFGMIDIDWTARKVAVTLKGMGGDDLDQVSVKFADLGLGE